MSFPYTLRAGVSKSKIVRGSAVLRHKVVSGAKMVFPGLKKEDERQNVIAYLETLKWRRVGRPLHSPVFTSCTSMTTPTCRTSDSDVF